MIVGSLGLASNIVGLCLFHGKLHFFNSGSNFLTPQPTFLIEHSHSHSHSHSPKRTTPSSRASSVEHIPTVGRVTSESTPKKCVSSHSHHSPSESFSSLYGHPVATRASLVQTANEMASAQSPHRGSLITSDPASQIPASESPQLNEVLTENTPLLHGEEGHKHKHGSHSHGQGSMNMRALVLHVVGDALGNVGVILTGLIIWQSNWQYKYYCDPVISLIITVIIFSNSLPLGMVNFLCHFRN